MLSSHLKRSVFLRLHNTAQLCRKKYLHTRIRGYVKITIRTVSTNKPCSYATYLICNCINNNNTILLHCSRGMHLCLQRGF